MSAPSHKTSPMMARREVEARTGTCQNMKTLGYRAVKYRLGGQPCRFQEIAGRGGPCYYIQRTACNRWRVGWLNGTTVMGARGRWYPERKVVSPLFPGPIAAALWLNVEKANGTVRFVES